MNDKEENTESETRTDLAMTGWELTTSGIICFNEEGEILYADRDTVSILGHTGPDSIKGEKIYSYIYTEYEQSLKAIIKRALGSGATSGGFVSLIGPNQEVVKANLTLTPYLNEPSEKKIVVRIDIIGVDPPGSELDNACYNKAAENLKSFLGTDEDQTDECMNYEPLHKIRMFKIDYKGNITSWNSYCERYFGHSSEDVLNKKTLYDLLNPGQTGGTNVLLRSFLAREKNFDADLKFSPRPGSGKVRNGHLDVIKAMECQGKSGGYICMFYPLDDDDEDHDVDPVRPDTAGSELTTDPEPDVPVAEVVLADTIDPIDKGPDNLDPGPEPPTPPEPPEPPTPPPTADSLPPTADSALDDGPDNLGPGPEPPAPPFDDGPDVGDPTPEPFGTASDDGPDNLDPGPEPPTPPEPPEPPTPPPTADSLPPTADSALDDGPDVGGPGPGSPSPPSPPSPPMPAPGPNSPPPSFLGYNDMAIVGSEGDIKFITDNFVQKLGFSSADELKEHNWFEFMTEHPDKKWSCEPARIPCKTREGTVLETDLQVIPLPDASGQLPDALWLLNKEDDERGFDPQLREPKPPPGPNATETALLQLNQDLVALNIIANVIEQYPDFHEMSKTIMDTIAGVISVEYGALYILKNDKVHLEYAMGLDNIDPKAQVLIDGDVDKIAEIADSSFKASIKSIIRSSATVPVQSNGTTYGFLAFASSTPMEFSNMDMEFVNTVSHLLATAIQRDTLRDECETRSTDYKLLYDDTPDLFINIDEKGTVKNCNRKTFEVTGYDRKDLVNKNIMGVFETMLGDEYDRFTDWLKTAEESENTPSIDLKFTFKNGGVRHFNVTAWHWESTVHNIKNGFRLMLRDITNYYNVKSHHRSSEELMDQIFNATNDLVLYVDNTRMILECNDSSLNLLGYERDEVRGQSVTMLYTNDLLMERYFEEMDKVYNTDDKTCEISDEQILRKKDGSMFVAMVTACSVQNDRGDITGMTLYITDITNRKRQEMELIEARKEKSFYMGILSDDVNGYNECAQSYLKLLNETDMTGTQKNYVDIVSEQVDSVMRLSDNVKMLAVIREENPNLVPVDLDRILRKTAYNIVERSQVQRSMGDIQLKLNYPKGLYGVKADGLIEELFSNLFWNAVKHNAHDKKILEISITQPDDNEDAYWQVEISDNAFGIPDEEKGIICNPQGDNKREMSGMGLSIINALVLRYGGRIWVENRVEDDHQQGSIFKIMLRKSDLEAADTVYGTGARC